MQETLVSIIVCASAAVFVVTFRFLARDDVRWDRNPLKQPATRIV